MNRGVLFKISSNVENYRIIFYLNGETICFHVRGKNKCIYLDPCPRMLKVVAIPESNGYCEPLYFFLTLPTCNIVPLNLVFVGTTPSLSINIFTLTDRNYGLPIDGTLTFVETL